MYKTPPEHYFRLHFERSRFSRRLEDALLLLANKIINLGIIEKEQFGSLLDEIIRKMNKRPIAEKTVRNQRTEMIRLFGLVKYADDVAIPGNRLSLLARTQDIPRFFKSFCKQFQFPAGFLKPDRVSEMVRAGVRFKPAKFIIQLLKIGESKYGDFAISAAEAAHFLFNDKRITVRQEKPVRTLERIRSIRKKKIMIDKQSDVIRYARDFMNYMGQANLLNEFRGMYALNKKEGRAMHAIIIDKEFFDGYSRVIKPDGSWDVEKYKRVDLKWMEWFADEAGDESLETPATALVKDDAVFPEQWKKIKEMLEYRHPKVRGEALKVIGDEGERIAFEYEKNVVGEIRKDLVRLVRIVSGTAFLGYDILSVHAKDGRRKKYIEVKTTKKNYSPETLIPFMITINEWSTAEQHGNDYFIYRVIITKEGISIFSIQNPVSQSRKRNMLIEPVGYKIIYLKKAGSFLGLHE